MKVLVVEDSRSVRTYLEGILRAESDVVLLRSAVDGRDALARAESERPDVILMDLELPELDGVSCIRAIMERAPCPIVVLSAHVDGRAHPNAFRSFDAGAVEVMKKPEGLSQRAIETFRERLVRTIRAMSTAHVVRRAASLPEPAQFGALGAHGARRTSPRVLAVGASTGGPPLLLELLQHHRTRPSYPIVIAQHIVPGFEEGFVRWLSTSGHDVILVRAGKPLLHGVVHVLPADRALCIDAAGFADSSAPTTGAMPSIDRAFEDLAKTSFGAGTLGVLLSGMGSDGAEGAKRVLAQGGEVWTQAGATCVVDGIPSAARRAKASSRDVTPDELWKLVSSFDAAVPEVTHHA